MSEPVTGLIVVGVIAACAIAGCSWACVVLARSLRDANARSAALLNLFANALMATSDYQLDRIRAEVGADTQRRKPPVPQRRVEPVDQGGLSQAELEVIDNLG